MTTGGLGPTDDDLTREVVAEVIELPLEEDAGDSGGPRGPLRAAQDRDAAQSTADRRRCRAAPSCSTTRTASAPGLWIETGGRIVVLLPGPPREMQPMFETHVAPRLAAFTTGRRVRRRVIKITGYAESLVDEKAQPIYTPLLHGPVPIETTILAAPGQIELHLSARGIDVPAMDAALEHAVGDLAAALVPVVFSVDGRSLEEVVGQTLKARGSADRRRRVVHRRGCSSDG